MQNLFNATLDDLLIEEPQAIAIAVSGGADSFALLHLAKNWAVKNGVIIHAFTVDHQLREASLSEAQAIGAWCAQQNIHHEILPWTGEKPTTGLQDAARNKRRELLFSACKKNNINTLLMAHQADDQAETFLMRLQRGSGLTGLTGIHPVTHDSGISIIRPLLNVRRSVLREYCVTHGLPFHDDPSNDNPVYERAALRQILKQLPDLADGVIKSVTRLTEADQALTTLALKHFENHQMIDGALWLPRDIFLMSENALTLRVLEYAFQTLDEEAIIPLTGLETLALNIKNDDFAGQTLAGAKIRPKIHNKVQGFLFEKEMPRKALKSQSL